MYIRVSPIEAADLCFECQIPVMQLLFSYASYASYVETVTNQLTFPEIRFLVQYTFFGVIELNIRLKL